MARVTNVTKSIARNYKIHRFSDPACIRNSQYEHISGGWGYGVSFDTTQNWLNLFSWDSWFGKHVSVTSQKKGHAFKLNNENENVKAVSCGRNHFLVLTTLGNVYSCGSNWFGQSGRTGQSGRHGDQLPLSLSQIQGISKAIKVSCGLDHSLILTESGKIFSCGWSTDGQTGTTRTETHIPVPKPVRGYFDGVFVTDVHTAADSSVAITDKNQIFVWGNNEYGQLGLSPKQSGNEFQVYCPVEFTQQHIDGNQISSVAVGGAFTAFLTDRGDLYYCGYGLQDTATLNSSSCSSSLRHLYTVPEEESLKGRVSIHAGIHYLALKTSEGFLIWGIMDGMKHPVQAYEIIPASKHEAIYPGLDGLYHVSIEQNN